MVSFLWNITSGSGKFCVMECCPGLVCNALEVQKGIYVSCTDFLVFLVVCMFARLSRITHFPCYFWSDLCACGKLNHFFNSVEMEYFRTGILILSQPKGVT